MTGKLGVEIYGEDAVEENEEAGELEVVHAQRT